MSDTPRDEQGRLQALGRYAILDTPPERAFDDIVNLTAQLLRMPAVAISFIDRDRQWFKAKIGIAADQTSRETAFCDHTIRADDVLVVADATCDERFKDNPYVRCERGIRFYAAAPLRTSDGFRLGTLCVTDNVLRPDYNEEKSGVLLLLSAVIVEMLEMRIAGRQLTDELRARQRAEERLRLMHAIAEAGNEAPDFAGAVMAVLRLLSNHFGADGAQVWSLGHGMLRCDLDAAYVAPGSGLEPYMEQIRQAAFTPENSIVGQTIVQQRVRAVVNGPDAEFGRFPYGRIASTYGIQSFMSVPFRGMRTDFALAFLFKRVHPDLAGVADLVRDISGQLQVMLARKEAEGRLREAERMEALGQLTTGVAHVLNNILTVIIGHLDCATAVPGVPHRLNQHLTYAAKASARAASFVDQLVTFSRRQHLRSRPIDINRQIGGILKQLGGRLSDDLTLAANLATDLWSVRVDPYPFDKALLALLENAREAMPGPGSVTISTKNIACGAVSARRLDITPGDYVAIAVADRGGGVLREVAVRAFEPFFTTKDPAIHYGLGLSQAHGFARQSLGAIELDGKPGYGVTVTMLLPRASPEAEIGSP